MRKLVVAALLFASRSASAGDAGFYADAGISGGYLWVSNISEMEYPPENAPILRYEWSLGAVFEPADEIEARVGAFVDALHSEPMSGSWGAALGAEGQLGWRTAGEWTIAGRLAVGGGDGSGSAASGTGAIFTPGVRARTDVASFGLDAMVVANDDDIAVGVLAGASLTGRPGRYVIGASAIGGALVGVLAFYAMSQANY